MYARFITAVVFLLIFFDAGAQWQVGLKGGASLSWFTRDINPFAPQSEYYDDYIGFRQHLRVAPTAGLVISRRLNSVAEAGAEALFTSRGARYRIRNHNVLLVDEDGQTQKAFDTYTYRVDYIELPVFLYMDVVRRGNRRAGVVAGVAPAYAINNKRIYRYFDGEGLATISDRQKKSKPLEDVRALNFFPMIGLKARENNVFVELRLSYPMLPTTARTVAEDGSNFSTKSWSVDAGFGIFL